MSETPPSWEYASSGDCIAAKLIDLVIGLVVLVIYLAITIPLSIAGGDGTSTLSKVILFGGALAYVFWEGRTGQTWGRKFTGLHLVSARTGHPIGFAKNLLRAFLVGLLGLIDIPLFFLTFSRWRLVRWIMNLRVIKLAPGAPFPQGPLPGSRGVPVEVDGAGILNKSLEQ